MSDRTKIQWCHSTVNPLMGCGGCELFPAPAEILAEIDDAIARIADWRRGRSRSEYKRLIGIAYERIKEPLAGHSPAVSTTNIWHLRDEFLSVVHSELGRSAMRVAERAIGMSVTCYAAKLHLNKGRSILNSTRQMNPGYAPAFEKLTRFEGRVWKMAAMKDLLGTDDPEKPWMRGLPRLIFVSDMGDAFSSERDFSFLQSEVIDPIMSEHGRRHLWLWLTKRPDRMARFGDRIGGFPPNVCVMTTITGPGKLDRIDALRRVPAAIRGLSFEPLWERVSANRLNLEGVSWAIVGGESGRADFVRPFQVEWAQEIEAQCRQSGVAYFLKQLGRAPFLYGKPLALRDTHGGDWEEWSKSLRKREFPEYFFRYRQPI